MGVWFSGNVKFDVAKYVMSHTIDTVYLLLQERPSYAQIDESVPKAVCALIEDGVSFVSQRISQLLAWPVHFMCVAFRGYVSKGSCRAS